MFRCFIHRSMELRVGTQVLGQTSWAYTLRQITRSHRVHIKIYGAKHGAKNAYAAQMLGELSQESRCKTSTCSRAHRHFLKLLMSPQHRKPWHHINHLLGVTLGQHGADLSAGENHDGLAQSSASAALTLPLPAFCFDPLKSSTTHEAGNVDCQSGQSWTHRSRSDSDLSWRGQASQLWAKGFRGLSTEGWPVVRQSITAHVIDREADRPAVTMAFPLAPSSSLLPGLLSYRHCCSHSGRSPRWGPLQKGAFPILCSHNAVRSPGFPLLSVSCFRNSSYGGSV